MSMAIEAKNAKQRATIACNIIKNQKNTFTRCFDDCFEMNDGAEVMECIILKAKKDRKLAYEISQKCLDLGYGESNLRLREAVKECLCIC